LSKRVIEVVSSHQIHLVLDALGVQLLAHGLSLQGNGAVTVNWSADNTARTRIIGLVT
jgi:hypothetical protein